MGVAKPCFDSTSDVRRGDAIDDLERRCPSEAVAKGLVSPAMDLLGDARGEAKEAGRLTGDPGEPAGEGSDDVSRDLFPAVLSKVLEIGRL